MKTASFARKVVACVSSMALAGALVPALALQAFGAESEAAEEVVLTVNAIEDGTEEVKPVKKFTQAQLDAAVETGTYHYLVVNRKGTPSVYKVTKLVPASKLFEGISVWKPGSRIKFDVYDNESGTGNYVPNDGSDISELVTYENVMDEQYFYPNYSKVGADADISEAAQKDKELTVSGLALDSASAKLDTEEGQLASEGLGSLKSDSSKCPTWVIGTTVDRFGATGPIDNKVMAGNIVNINIYYKPVDFSKAKVTLAKASAAYTGKTQKPSVKSVTLGDVTFEEGVDYTVSAKSGKNVGSYKVTLAGDGMFCKGSAETTFKITKASNKVTPKKTAVTKSYKANKKTKKLGKTAKISLPKTTAKFGTVKYKVFKKDSKKVLSLSGKKVKVKSSAKKGKTYTIKVKAYVKGTSNYKAASKTITVKVKIK